MNVTPKELLNIELSLKQIESYFPGASICWDIDDGPLWAIKYHNCELGFRVIGGTLSACVTENKPGRYAPWPVYHWAFYDEDLGHWRFT